MLPQILFAVKRIIDDDYVSLLNFFFILGNFKNKVLVQYVLACLASRNKYIMCERSRLTFPWMFPSINGPKEVRQISIHRIACWKKILGTKGSRCRILALKVKLQGILPFQFAFTPILPKQKIKQTSQHHFKVFQFARNSFNDRIFLKDQNSLFQLSPLNKWPIFIVTNTVNYAFLYCTTN